MTRRQRQVELESRVRNWSAVAAGAGAMLAATSSQDPAMSLVAKWLALLEPGVILGLAVAVASVYANAFMRAMQERKSRREELEAIEPIKVEEPKP